MTDRGWITGGEPMFAVDSFVQSNGEIGAFGAGVRPIRRVFPVARVVKADGNQIVIQPGSFHGGRWRGIRWSFTVHGEDLSSVPTERTDNADS